MEETSLEKQNKSYVSLKDKRLFKFYQFMVSYKFVLIAFVSVFLFQAILWVIFGGIEAGIFSSEGSTGKRLFVGPGFFDFTSGCIMSTNVLIIILSEAIVYIAIEIFSLILCVKSDRDTWNIKKETLVYVVVQIIVVIAFVVSGMLQIVSSLIDYLFPYLIFLLIGLSMEVIICVILPICYELRREWKGKKVENVKETTTEYLLNNKKAFKVMLDFARRRFVFH